MRRFALFLAILPGFAFAAEFRTLSDDEILTALTGQKLSYGQDIWQTFQENGQTDYFAGGPSTGSWTVRGGRYCSAWPPSDLWACYDVLQKGDTIRFVDDQGSITDGTISK